MYYVWIDITIQTGSSMSCFADCTYVHLRQPTGSSGTLGTAFPSVLAVVVWTTVPLGMSSYLTSLQHVDFTLIDSAKIDGAGGLRITTAILWPLLRPTTALLIIVGSRVVLEDFQYFLILTDGGPLNRSNTLALEIIDLAS